MNNDTGQPGHQQPGPGGGPLGPPPEDPNAPRIPSAVPNPSQPSTRPAPGPTGPPPQPPPAAPTPQGPRNAQGESLAAGAQIPSAVSSPGKYQGLLGKRPDASDPNEIFHDAMPDRLVLPDLPDIEEFDPDDDSDTVKAFFRELPVLLGVAFILAFVLRTFVVQVFYIPSASMENTLQINDRITVEKISYRIGEPDRGDIIVFDDESDSEVDTRSLPAKVIAGAGQFVGLVPANTQEFVKRIAGEPGDIVHVCSGSVFVNGAQLDESAYLVAESIPRAVSSDGQGTEQAPTPFVVPEGEYFVLGDNRGNSSDSRDPNGFGFVRGDHIVGRVNFVLWPFSRTGGVVTADHVNVPDVTPELRTQLEQQNPCATVGQ